MTRDLGTVVLRTLVWDGLVRHGSVDLCLWFSIVAGASDLGCRRGEPMFHGSVMGSVIGSVIGISFHLESVIGGVAERLAGGLNLQKRRFKTEDSEIGLEDSERDNLFGCFFFFW